MIGRRNSPDGLPFRLYAREGKFKTSYGYKLPDGTWAFRLSAPTANAEKVAEIRRQAIEQAETLNGKFVPPDSVEALIKKYFAWQRALPASSQRKKAKGTIEENERESKNLVKVFGAMRPADIKSVDIYGYLAAREVKGAPIKANKEVALLSAVLEYGRRLGQLETNPCRGIRYNPSNPRTKYVEKREIDLMMETARERGGSYLVLALCLYTAYLTVSRPTEMRQLARQHVTDEGVRVPVGKRKGGQVQRMKLIEWSTELRAAIDEAKSLQRIAGMYVFANASGQVYSTSGFNTILTRLMKYCAIKAAERGIEFARFTLADMRPTAVTDRMEGGDLHITNATGHADERMVHKVYDRRRTKRAKATK
jgi:integrase